MERNRRFPALNYLLLIRHGSAAPTHPTIIDFNRPLSPRGREECNKMGPLMRGWFQNRGLNPPLLILSSPARRTRETVERISPSIYGAVGPVIFEESLYLPSTADFLKILRRQDDGVDCLALCSHNPGITLLADYLFGPFPHDFSPCGMALGSLNIKRWSQVDKGNGRLLEFLNP